MHVRPVTHTADVEVNNASTKLTLTPGRAENGIVRRKAPNNMTEAKLKTSI